MFGLIADLISSVTTILLPIYASYKALRTFDPAQLTPWLLYWVVLSSILLVESWTVFVIGWLPFYSWIRLILLSYLVLPQTQGAKFLYYTYIEPFIVQHEQDIDVFIGQSHEKLSAAGLGYLNQLIDLFCERVLGRAPASKETPPSSTTASYAGNLFSRFSIPAARGSIVAPASDFYGMLSGAVAAAAAASSNLPSSGSSRTRELQVESLTASGSLYPKNMNLHSTSQKQEFIAAQKEKLSILMKALDQEQQNLDLAYGEHGLSEKVKNKSTHSFEQVEYSDAENESSSATPTGAGRRTTSGNWLSSPSSWNPWATGANARTSTTAPDIAGSSPGWNAARDMTDAIQGTSSGVDHNRR